MTKKKSVEAKLPPFDEDVEQAVLGAILVERDAMIRVFKDFKPDIFYKEANRIVSESLLDLYSQSRKIDLMTVVNDLRVKGKLEVAGGAYYLTQLMDRVVSSYHLEAHLEILNNHYIARAQITEYTKKIADLYDLQDPYEIANEVSNTLISLQEDSYSDNEYSMRELALESIRTRESLGMNKVSFTGYSSGIKALDRVIMGIKEPDLTIIAGRPAMGKTAVALTIARSLASQTPVSVFSLEMSAKQLYGRMLSSESQVWSKRIKTNDLNEKEREFLSYADQSLGDVKIYINDTPALNIDKFRSIAMIHKRKYGIGAIIIDYLQLMKGNTKGFGNSNAEITEISGKLKRVAKELKIPIIALAQLSRAVESRKDDSFKPKLSDLRESGSIEQDADNVIFLWRPEYYELKDPISSREYNRDLSPENLLMFIVAKCREGETKSVPAYIDLSKMQVKDHPDIEYLLNSTQEKLPF